MDENKTSPEMGPQPVHIERQDPLSATFANEKALLQDVKEATVAEHTLTFWRGLVTHRKAVFWSIMVSASIIMEGYDVRLHSHTIILKLLLLIPS